jgi:hypothetical protein
MGDDQPDRIAQTSGRRSVKPAAQFRGNLMPVRAVSLSVHAATSPSLVRR